MGPTVDEKYGHGLTRLWHEVLEVSAALHKGGLAAF